MADINNSAKNSAGQAALSPDAGAEGAPGAAKAPVWDIIELLLFAYRDFVGDPDEVLAKYAFGRAHHRVLHFVNRNPGMKVADLLDILNITKQSLGRVLKQLLDEGYIVQKAGDNDRRQRLLFATAKGEALVTKLAGLQTTRITRALEGMEPAAADNARQFLLNMIDHEDPDKVLDVILKSGRKAKDAR